MGKFDDFKKHGQIDQHEEDIYGDAGYSNPNTEVLSNQRLQQRVKGQKIEKPIYENVTEIEKTTDLKFINNVLNQRIIERQYTLEIISGESKINKTTEKWIPIPSE